MFLKENLWKTGKVVLDSIQSTATTDHEFSRSEHVQQWLLASLYVFLSLRLDLRRPSTF